MMSHFSDFNNLFSVFLTKIFDTDLLFFYRYFILDYFICNGLFPEMYQGVEFDPLVR